MVSERVQFSLCLLVILISQATADSDDQYPICYTNADYAPNSTYQTNLHTVLSRLTSNIQIDYGFYSSSYGQDSDRVYATGLCRGDITPHTCRTCLNNSSFFLLNNCTHQKEAVGLGGYDICMLHYADRSISGYQESESLFWFWWESNVTDWDEYSYVLNKLLSTLKVKAATTESSLNRKFASGNVTALSSETLYSVVQCSPELTVAECKDCLDGAFSDIPKYCKNRSGCGITKLSCNFRYENSSFYEPMADTITLQLSTQGSPLPLPSPSIYSSKSNYHGKNNRSRAVIAIVVPIVVFVGLLISFCIYLRVRKSTKYFESEAEADHEIRQAESSQFDFDTIRIATNNFSDANKLGQGGFGPVYKGNIFNGKEVAVKRLSSNSSQGDIEFKNEVQLMSKLQHRNLVRLLGFCFEREERLLVYEFLPNKSLDKIIFDPTERGHLDWRKRYKIIEGIAQGLVYLHEDSQQRIIHRDLKLSNILLDANMNSKISDFGLARLFVVDETHFKASKIAGTLWGAWIIIKRTGDTFIKLSVSLLTCSGYMAPEYARNGKFSVKSDVFSFGVMILEIISGQKNSGFRNGNNVEHLISFAWKNWRKGTADTIVDPALNKGLRDEIVRCIQIGLLCVQEKVADRPTMASVVLMLDGYSFALPVPNQPAYFMTNSCLSDIQFLGSSSVETLSNKQKSDSADASANEASISSLYPR